MRTKSDAKRRAVLEAAATTFLERGLDTSTMDEIAARAGVSKRTVYDHFGDKATLFSAVVEGVVEHAAATTDALAARLESIDAVEPDLADLAVDYARAVLRPEVLRARRLVIREADRHPDVARRYYENAPAAAIRALAVGLRRFHRLGLLRIERPDEAAEQLAYMVLGPALDRGLLLPWEPLPTSRTVARRARRATAAFVAAHRVG